MTANSVSTVNCAKQEDKYALKQELTIKQAYEEPILFKKFREADINSDGTLSANEIEYFNEKEAVMAERKSTENEITQKNDKNSLLFLLTGIVSLFPAFISEAYKKPVSKLGKAGAVIGFISIGLAITSGILKANKSKTNLYAAKNQFRLLDDKYKEKIAAEAKPVTARNSGSIYENMSIEEAYHNSTALHYFQQFDKDKNGTIDSDEYKYYKYLMELKKQNIRKTEDTNANVKSYLKHYYELLAETSSQVEISWENFKAGLLTVKPENAN